jgi:hypothetical protein
MNAAPTEIALWNVFNQVDALRRLENLTHWNLREKQKRGVVYFINNERGNEKAQDAVFINIFCLWIYFSPPSRL